MYDLRNRKDLFGIEGYDPPKKYADPVLQMKLKEMELNQKKGLKPNKYVTKRGSYIVKLAICIKIFLFAYDSCFRSPTIFGGHCLAHHIKKQQKEATSCLELSGLARPKKKVNIYFFCLPYAA